MQRRTFLEFGAAAALAASFPLRAQSSWPAKPIRLVVPFAPNGGTDTIARLVAPGFSSALGQPMVIENKPGASGTIGAAYVAKAAPDGYTLFMSNNASLATGPLVYSNVGYDPVRDFVPIVQIGTFPNGFLVRGDHPAKTMQEFIAMARANPGKLTFASAGTGSAGHLTGEMLKLRAHIDMQHIPYKGTGPAKVGLLSGQIDALFDGLAAAKGLVTSGKVRMLAIASAKRLPAFPDVPTLNEIVPGVIGVAWFGISAPAHTPRVIVERVQAAGQKILAQPEMQQRFAGISMTITALGSADYGKFMENDIARWAPVVKAAHVHVG